MLNKKTKKKINLRGKDGFDLLDAYNRKESQILGSRKYNYFAIGTSIALILWSLIFNFNVKIIGLGAVFLAINVAAFFLKRWRENKADEEWFENQIALDQENKRFEDVYEEEETEEDYISEYSDN